MRWLVLLGGVFLLVVWLVLRGAPDAADASVKREQPRPAVPSTSNAPVVQTPVAEPTPTAPAIVLRGVVFRGAGSDQSQALLDVGGRSAQMFRTGEAVDQGWMLESIQADHVLIVKGGVISRLDVVGEAGAATTASGAATVKDKPLPGFAKGPPPAAALSTAPSREQNQRFLRDRQKRLDGTGPATR